MAATKVDQPCNFEKLPLQTGLAYTHLYVAPLLFFYPTVLKKRAYDYKYLDPILGAA